MAVNVVFIAIVGAAVAVARTKATFHGWQAQDYEHP